MLPISNATATEAPTAVPATEAPAAFTPVTIENCGVTQTFKTPPQHAVSMNQHATEIMLELGLQDHMVGTAYLDDTILPELATAYNAVPVLATDVMRGLRMVKEAAEIDALRKAGAAIDRVHARVPEFLMPGYFPKMAERVRTRLAQASSSTESFWKSCTRWVGWACAKSARASDCDMLRRAARFREIASTAAL